MARLFNAQRPPARCLSLPPTLKTTPKLRLLLPSAFSTRVLQQSAPNSKPQLFSPPTTLSTATITAVKLYKILQRKAIMATAPPPCKLHASTFFLSCYCLAEMGTALLRPDDVVVERPQLCLSLFFLHLFLHTAFLQTSLHISLANCTNPS